MNDYRNLSDAELCDLLKEGNHYAFNEIHSRYYPLLYRHAYKRLPYREEVKDIMQELFTHIWNEREKLIFTSGLDAYLYVATRNKVINIFNRQKIREVYTDSLQNFLATGENITDWAVRVKELTALVEQEIAALPPQMRKVFELSRNSHLSHHEIGELLNTSPLTVKKQIHNALKILRAKLGANVFFMFF